MHVVRKDLDALNGQLIVEITPDDYTQKVKNNLEKYRKTAKIPGFRPGHTPFAVIEKRFGKAVLAEELNQLAHDGLNRYIQENQLNLLGNPIPSAQSPMEGSLDQPGLFRFSFDIGLPSAFDYESVLKSGVEYHTVRVDDKLINQQIEDLRRRYGKLISVEESGEKDLLMGVFRELQEDGTVKEDGIQHTTTLTIEFLPNAEAKSLLVGKKPGDQIALDPSLVAKDTADKASLLGLTAETLPAHTEHFRFEITEVKRMEMAELDSTLFEKLFPDGSITQEDQLKERVKKDLDSMFERDADRLMTRKVYEHLLSEVQIAFPEDFLKRWIKMSASTPIADEDIEKEFEDYLKSLKWQLIQSKIFKDSNIRLSFEEVIAFTKGLIASNYAQYGIPAPEDKELEASARELLAKKDQANSIYDQLAEEKLTQFFKGHASLKIKPLSYDDFMAKMKG